MSQHPSHESGAAQLHAATDEPIGPRDLYRAMLIALAMNEHGMAERLRVALQDAFAEAGAPIPPGADAIRPILLH